MELDDSFFSSLADEKEKAKNNISFFYTLEDEYKKLNEKFFAYTFHKRAERIQNCLSYWEWYKYEKNKVLELRKVFRCKDLFCPNCRKMGIVKAIIKFIPYFNVMLALHYNPYLMTLTVPNIKGENLSQEIKKMNKAIAKFMRWLSKPFKDNGKYYGGYSSRLFDVIGAIRVLEVAVQKSDWNYFHVHFHIIAFLNRDNEQDFFKDIPGGYQNNSQSYIYYSMADISIQKLWKMAYDGIDITEFKNASDDWHDNYICDIRPMKDKRGIYEVFKYCFKDIDIKNVEVFKYLCLGLKGKRIRQGYGRLYKLKLDDKDLIDVEVTPDDIKNYLEFKDELPVIVANNFKDNTEKYVDYKKISIKNFNKKIFF